MIYTRFERARILGARALQISMGAPPIVPGLADGMDAMAIAVHEFASADIPITVQRLAHGRD